MPFLLVVIVWNIKPEPMESKDLFEKIEAYLLNKLSPTERQAFEEQISNDPKLAENVALQRFELDMMEVLLEEETKTKFDQWTKESATAPPNKPQFNRWIILLTIVLIAMVSFWIYNQNKSDQPSSNTIAPSEPPTQQITPEETPIENKTPESNDTPKPANQPQSQESTKSEQPIAEQEKTTTADNQLLATAIALYETPDLLQGTVRSDQANSSAIQAAFQAKAYQKVIDLLENAQIPIAEQQQLAGHAHFGLGQYPQASQAFESIISGDDPALSEEVEWFYLLALLAQQQQDQAAFQSTLRNILDDPEHKDYEKTSKELAPYLNQ